MLDRTLLAVVFLFFSCQDDKVSVTKTDASSRRLSVTADVEDAGKMDHGPGTDSTQSQDSGTEENQPSDPDNIVNEVDTVRPPKTTKPEKVLSRPSFPAPTADQMIEIPAGTFLRGSAPQDTLRDQFAENDNEPTKITSFHIDALPYPGDPTRPFLTGVSYQEAKKRCSDQGKRLCTELEWEFACRSEDNRRYPTGNTYDSSAYPDSDPIQPASPFGVFAMGRTLEWTHSRWGKDPDQVERIAVRGFAPNQMLEAKTIAAVNGRRCAKRWHRQPETIDPEIGFRCCKGPVNKEEVYIERPRPAHSIYTNMKPDKFEKVIMDVPELSMIHDSPHMFSDGDIRAVLARRANDRKELKRQGIHFTWKPVRWIPRQGMELWVAVGRSRRHSFVVALHETLDNEKYVHASSIIIWNQAIPLALAYREGHRDQLYWAPCWGCRDGGTIEFDDEKNEVIVTHKW